MRRRERTERRGRLSNFPSETKFQRSRPLSMLGSRGNTWCLETLAAIGRVRPEMRFLSSRPLYVPAHRARVSLSLAFGRRAGVPFGCPERVGVRPRLPSVLFWRGAPPRTRRARSRRWRASQTKRRARSRRDAPSACESYLEYSDLNFDTEWSLSGVCGLRTISRALLRSTRLLWLSIEHSPSSKSWEMIGKQLSRPSILCFK